MRSFFTGRARWRFRPPLKVVLPTVAALGAGTAVAVGSIPGPGGTITGCYWTIPQQIETGATAYGTLRLIDPSQRTVPNVNPTVYSCRTTLERTITWNQQGPPGQQGARGPQGVQGPPGRAGRTPDPACTGLDVGTPGQGAAIAITLPCFAAGGLNMTYSVTSVPRHGKLTAGAHPGLFAYAPGRSFVGTDAFFFRATNSAGASPVKRARIRVPLSLPTMTWSFRPNRRFTVVSHLAAVGVPASVSVKVQCHGGGCPFTGVRTAGRAADENPATVDLSSWFKNRQLRVGTRLTVSMVGAGIIGKAFIFTMRSSQTPAREVGCLAPSKLEPGAPC